MDWFQIGNILIPLAGMGTGLIVMSGIYRLASKALDRKAISRLPEHDAKIEFLQDELERLRDEHGAQLEEMQERLDFTERILANPGRPEPRGTAT